MQVSLDRGACHHARCNRIVQDTARNDEWRFGLVTEKNDFNRLQSLENLLVFLHKIVMSSEFQPTFEKFVVIFHALQLACKDSPELRVWWHLFLHVIQPLDRIGDDGCEVKFLAPAKPAKHEGKIIDR